MVCACGPESLCCLCIGIGSSSTGKAGADEYIAFLRATSETLSCPSMNGRRCLRELWMETAR